MQDDSNFLSQNIEIACRVQKKVLILYCYQKRPRKDAGVVDRGGLENRCAFLRTQGSNPCLSAITKIETR